MRDFEKEPYTAQELKVVKYLKKLIPDVGAGDDPIGFLIASHAVLVKQFKDSRK